MGLLNGAGFIVFQFLTELTRLFQKCRLSGSVFITLKKCKQLSTRQGLKEAGRPSDPQGWVPTVWAQSGLRNRRILVVAGAVPST